MSAIGKGWGPKLSGNLANYVNTSRGTLLLGDIQAHMIKENAKPSTRRQDVIHPSETSKEGWCPRATYYRILACREANNPYLKPAETIAPQLLNIFDEGHYIHDKWQRRLWKMGDLWGNWKCMRCDTFVKSNNIPDKCHICGAGIEIMQYLEVPLRYPPLRISGSADGAIPRLKSLIEIKSVGAGTVRIEAPEIYANNSNGTSIDLQGLWKDIKEPFPSHIRQGQLYLNLCELLELPFDQIIFIYEAKFNQGVKEFVVKYDPSISKPIVRDCVTIVSALDLNGSIPECPNGISCKDCEQYGTQKSDSERLVRNHDSERKAIRRPAHSATRIIRPAG